MAKATASPPARRRSGDRPRGKAKTPKHKTKETSPPKHESAWKHEINRGFIAPFLLTRSVHFHAAIWHNLSPPLTAEHGDAQFVLPDVLRVPPISNHGQVAEIVRLFGGVDRLRSAVTELQNQLYATIPLQHRNQPGNQRTLIHPESIGEQQMKGTRNA